MVVHHVGEVVGGHAVRLDEHIVVQIDVVHGDGAEDHIRKGGRALGGHVLAHHIGQARIQLGLNFRLGKA